MNTTRISLLAPTPVGRSLFVNKARDALMNDIIDDLNSWLDLLVVERRFRQETGDEPAPDTDLVTRAIDEIASLRTKLAAAKDASS